MSVAELRQALASLPRADNHKPGAPVVLDELFTVKAHRSALDPDRPLVVGNRGMGKSFWAHALVDEVARGRVTKQLSLSSLGAVTVRFGFNGSERADPVAPTPETLRAAAGRKGARPELLWRAVLARACAQETGTELPPRFADVVRWVDEDPERYTDLVTDADDRVSAAKRKLLLIFDALDRLGEDWTSTQALVEGLLKVALSTQSFRALRVKLFLRLDQFSDLEAFGFPDSSKLRSNRVDLQWDVPDLYGLLFHRLRREPAFKAFEEQLGNSWFEGTTESLVENLAGKWMGTDKRRGSVFTWVPTHLADALGQIAPRTFLTTWREAASHGSAPKFTAIDYHGITEGVRRASEDRLAELSEDYPWVHMALEPLRGKTVPLERVALQQLWKKSNTFEQVLASANETGRHIATPLRSTVGVPEEFLIDALQVIGVIEVRSNGKVNVPDIFRVEAGIKRMGGVKPPVRSDRSR